MNGNKFKIHLYPVYFAYQTLYKYALSRIHHTNWVCEANIFPREWYSLLQGYRDEAAKFMFQNIVEVAAMMKLYIYSFWIIFQFRV